MKWITREYVKVDRVACPWLTKNFVDKDAEFLFVPSDKVMEEAKRLDAIPYDVKNVELGHHGKKCSFEAILKNMALRIIRPSSFSEKSGMARTRTIRFIISQKDRVWRRLPKAFVISATKTTTKSMQQSGSSMMHCTLTANRW